MVLSNERVYHGWFVVGACFVGSFASLGLSLSFGVFFEPLLVEYDMPRGVTSLVFSIQTLVLYLSGAVLGLVVDRYGARRFLTVGTVLFFAGLVWTSYSRTFLTLTVAYGIVTAVGMGLIYIISYATVPRWFERRRGLASGVASSGLAVGLLFIAPIASVLIESFGWRSTYLLIVATITAFLAVAIATIDDTPLDRNVDPSFEFPSGYPDYTLHRQPWGTQIRTVVEIITKRRFLLIFLAWVLLYGTMYVVLVHIAAYATDIGMSKRIGSAAIAIIGATSIVGRVTVGFGADRLGRTRMFVVSGVTMAGATLLLPTISTPVGLFLLAVFFGIGQGGNGALLSPITADLFGTDNMNALFGTVSMSFALSGLLAPPIAGMIFDVSGSYVPAFLISGVVGLAGAALIAIVS